MAPRTTRPTKQAPRAVLSSLVVLGIFAACGGSVLESSETNPVPDGSVSGTEPAFDASVPIADVSIPHHRDSGLTDFDARGPADARVVIVGHPSVDGGNCATTADCEPGYFCSARSDEYNPGDNGVACLPFPAGCDTCACALEVTAAFNEPYHPGCACFTDPGTVPNQDPNATPVLIIGCSEA